jgi:hypothetical protein
MRRPAVRRWNRADLWPFPASASVAEAGMSWIAEKMVPFVRREADLVAGGMAAVVILAFLGWALATTTVELARLVVAATSG